MAKDAYYFSHDANAHQDPKITKMLLSLKAEGYGIYWVIVEMLRSEETLMLSHNDYDAIAYQSHSNPITVARVVKEFDLFCVKDNGTFYSNSLIKRVEQYRDKSKKYTENANKRWEKERRNAMAMQSHSNGNALKERKVKESKLNNTTFIPPTIEEVKDYCLERKNNVDVNKWHNFYSAKDWMIGKNKIKDWKACVRTWEKEEVKTDKRKFFN